MNLLWRGPISTNIDELVISPPLITPPLITPPLITANNRTLDEILVPLESDEHVFMNQEFGASMEHLFSITVSRIEPCLTRVGFGLLRWSS